MLRCNRLVDAPKNMGYTPAKAFNKIHTHFRKELIKRGVKRYE